MSYKIIIENLPLTTDSQGLRDLVAVCGEVLDLKVIMDHVSGISRGFAFVTYASREGAQAAIDRFNGKYFNGRCLAVNWALIRLAQMPAANAAQEKTMPPFPEQELRAWLKRHPTWNHYDWLDLLEDLRRKGYGPWPDSPDGPAKIGLFLETQRG